MVQHAASSERTVTVHFAFVTALRDEHSKTGAGWRTLARKYHLRPYTVKKWLAFERRLKYRPRPAHRNP